MKQPRPYSLQPLRRIEPMLVSRRSPVTGKINEMDLPIQPIQLHLWQEGMLIQNAMPNLTAEQREFLISGCTQEDWDKLYPKEENQ